MRRLSGSGKREETLPFLDLPLAARGFPVLRAVQGCLVVVAVLAALSTAWIGWDTVAAWEAAQHYEEWAARVESTNLRFAEEARAAGYDVSPQRSSRLGREVQFMKRLVHKRTFSWTQLLSDLEAVVPARVSLVSVTLNFTDSMVAITGAALTLDDLRTFVNALEKHDAFSQAVLTQHQVADRDGGVDLSTMTRAGKTPPLDFTLAVRYGPASQEGRRG